MRRALHVKGDVMCTMLLLVLFCLLLYARQVRLKSVQIEDKFTFLKNHLSLYLTTLARSLSRLQMVLYADWDTPALKLDFHGSTSSSRTLLGTGRTKEGRDSPRVRSDLFQ